MVTEIVQQTTTTTLAISLFDTSLITLVVTAVAIVAGVLTALYTALQIREYRALKVQLLNAVRTDLGNLGLTFRIRNGRQRSTSIAEANHEWGLWSRFFYRLFGTLGHQEPTLRELNSSEVYDAQFIHSQKQLESAGKAVTLPLKLDAGETKNFHVILDRSDPDQRHHLVISTTDRKFVKRLNPALFRGNFVHSIRLMGD